MNNNEDIAVRVVLRACVTDAKAKLKEIAEFEIDPDTMIDSYRDSINEAGPVQIWGLTYDMDQVLEAVDPTAFRCGLNGYVDSLDVTDDPNYKYLLEELDDIRADLDTHLDKASDLIDEILESAPDACTAEWDDWNKETAPILAELRDAEREGIEALTEIDNL